MNAEAIKLSKAKGLYTKDDFIPMIRRTIIGQRKSQINTKKSRK